MGYVLVADDDPAIRGLLVDFLNTLGIPHRQVSNGAEVLEIVKKDPPDLILLDIMMPVMDGLTTLTRLHSDPVGQRIPVILLSAVASDQQTMIRLPGVVGVLRKGGFSLIELKEALQKALGKPTADQPLSPD